MISFQPNLSEEADGQGKSDAATRLRSQPLRVSLVCIFFVPRLAMKGFPIARPAPARSAQIRA
jgi:hypothetical protein